VQAAALFAPAEGTVNREGLLRAYAQRPKLQARLSMYACLLGDPTFPPPRTIAKRRLLDMEPARHMLSREGCSLLCKISPIVALLSVALLGPAAAEPSTTKITGPLVASGNPNYFKDATGVVLILTGSHTWNTLQDWGSDGSPQTLDFEVYVSFLIAHTILPSYGLRNCRRFASCQLRRTSRPI
jgi:hypothetical protein